MCRIKSAVLHKHPSKCPLSSGSYQNNEKIKSQSISPELKTCLILKSKSKTFRSKSGNSLSSSRKVVDELCYFSIYNPMIHNPTMHNSCINYLNTVGKLYFGK